MSAHSQVTGIYPADTYGTFQVKGASIVFSLGDLGWINVWAPGRESYLRYGYNEDRGGWYFGEKPKEATAILRSILPLYSDGKPPKAACDK